LDDGSGTGTVQLFDPERSITVSTIDVPEAVAVAHHIDGSVTPASLTVEIEAVFPGIHTAPPTPAHHPTNSPARLVISTGVDESTYGDHDQFPSRLERLAESHFSHR
jgi:hypothetical protein